MKKETMIVYRGLLNGFLVITLTMSVLIHNSTATSDSRSEGGDGSGDGGAVIGSKNTTPSPSLMDRVTDVMDNVKQQTSETLDGAGSTASMLSLLRPSTTKQTSEVGGKGLRASEKKLPSGDNTPGRLQETKGHTVIAAKKVVDKTIHKLQTTVSDIRLTIISDDWDDVEGDRRKSNSLDGLFRPWVWRSRRHLSKGPPRTVVAKKSQQMKLEPWRKVDLYSSRDMKFNLPISKDPLYLWRSINIDRQREMEFNKWYEKKFNSPMSKEEVHPVYPWRKEEVPPSIAVTIDPRGMMEMIKWIERKSNSPMNKEEVHPVYPWRKEEVLPRSEKKVPPRRTVNIGLQREIDFNKWSEKKFNSPMKKEEVHPVYPWKKEEVPPKSEEKVHPKREEEIPPRKAVNIDPQKEMEFNKWSDRKFNSSMSNEEVPPRSEEKVHPRKEEEVPPRRNVEVNPRTEVSVPAMHPLTINSYNNTSNSLTNSDYVIIILIIITTII